MPTRTVSRGSDGYRDGARFGYDTATAEPSLDYQQGYEQQQQQQQQQQQIQDGDVTWSQDEQGNWWYQYPGQEAAMYVDPSVAATGGGGEGSSETVAAFDDAAGAILGAETIDPDPVALPGAETIDPPPSSGVPEILPDPEPEARVQQTTAEPEARDLTAAAPAFAASGGGGGGDALEPPRRWRLGSPAAAGAGGSGPGRSPQPRRFQNRRGLRPRVAGGSRRRVRRRQRGGAAREDRVGGSRGRRGGARLQSRRTGFPARAGNCQGGGGGFRGGGADAAARSELEALRLELEARATSRGTSGGCVVRERQKQVVSSDDAGGDDGMPGGDGATPPATPRSPRAPRVARGTRTGTARPRRRDGRWRRQMEDLLVCLGQEERRRSGWAPRGRRGVPPIMAELEAEAEANMAAQMLGGGDTTAADDEETQDEVEDGPAQLDAGGEPPVREVTRSDADVHVDDTSFASSVAFMTDASALDPPGAAGVRGFGFGPTRGVGGANGEGLTTTPAPGYGYGDVSIDGSIHGVEVSGMASVPDTPTAGGAAVLRDISLPDIPAFRVGDELEPEPEPEPEPKEPEPKEPKEPDLPSAFGGDDDGWRDGDDGWNRDDEWNISGEIARDGEAAQNISGWDPQLPDAPRP